MDNCVEAKEESTITRSMRILLERVDNLTKIGLSLHDRLAPILTTTPAPSQETEKATLVETCPLEKDINEIISKIDINIKGLRSIIERLQI